MQSRIYRIILISLLVNVCTPVYPFWDSFTPTNIAETACSWGSWAVQHATSQKALMSLGATAIAGALYAYKTKNNKITKTANVKIEPINADPKDTRILWDIHSTLVKKDPKRMAKTLVSHLASHPSILLNILKPAFWGTTFILLKQRATGASFAQQYKQYDPNLSALVIKVANCQNPIPEQVALLKLLHEKGFEQEYCSDIGVNVLPGLKAQNSEIFNILQKGKAVDYSQEKPVTKKNPAYFADVKQTSEKKSVFIDDKKKYTDLAQKQGLIAIHYCNNTQAIKKALLGDTKE